MLESFPRIEESVPFLTEQEMREVDRAMVDDYGVALVQMMEHAGRNLANVARTVFFRGSVTSRNVLVAAGPGGNGGGGLSGARQIHNMGAVVTIALTAPIDNMIAETALQLRTLQASGVRVIQANELDLGGMDLVVDAIFGYSLRGDPRGEAAGLIEQIVRSELPILSNDIPSGIEATSGRIGNPSIKATATVTIALPKSGLKVSAARPLVGNLFLGNIAVPPDLYPRSFPDMALKNPFEAGDIVQIW